MSLLHMPPRRLIDDDEPWLTQELLSAYYVAIAVDPEIVHASAVVRQSAVDRVLAGMRASRDLNDAVDAKGRDQCIALMRQDALQEAARVARGGF